MYLSICEASKIRPFACVLAKVVRGVSLLWTWLGAWASEDGCLNCEAPWSLIVGELDAFGNCRSWLVDTDGVSVSTDRGRR